MNESRLSAGSPTGNSIFNANQVYDMKILPSGNLMVLSAYGLNEATTTGSLVRSIDTSIRLVYARGLEFDPATNSLYITMIGFSGQFFRLMRVDATTGQVEVNESYGYGDDLFLTSDSRLLVGSRTQVGDIFDTDLNQVGGLSSIGEMFATQLPLSVSEPSYLVRLVFILGLFLLRRNPERAAP